jgi:hypothetical protein|eukprot:COSAG02_NODE_1108_length_14539_cov_4.353393_3_plen_52_part_00
MFDATIPPHAPSAPEQAQEDEQIQFIAAKSVWPSLDVGSTAIDAGLVYTHS